MSFVNPSFETAGANPGEANGWGVVVLSSFEEYADFDSALTSQSKEDFEEGWSDNQNFIFDLTGISSLALFRTGLDGFEAFEQGWNNDVFYLRLTDAPTLPAFFDTTPQAFEDFEEEWDDNENFHFNLVGIVSVAQFDSTPQNFEDFEEEWDDNENFDYVLGTASTAQFDDGTAPAETFEGERPVGILIVPGEGPAKDIDETGRVEVVVSGTFVATLQVQSRFGNTWRDEGTELTGPDTVALDSNISQIRIKTISYTSGSPTAVYRWGQMETI